MIYNVILYVNFCEYYASNTELLKWWDLPMNLLNKVVQETPYPIYGYKIRVLVQEDVSNKFKFFIIFCEIISTIWLPWMLQSLTTKIKTILEYRYTCNKRHFEVWVMNVYKCFIHVAKTMNTRKTAQKSFIKRLNRTFVFIQKRRKKLSRSQILIDALERPPRRREDKKEYHSDNLIFHGKHREDLMNCKMSRRRRI